MSSQIFVNLPVRDLARSKAFHEALGHTINPKFTNDDAACVVVSDSIYFMLLTRAYFQGFTERQICDTATHIEVITALSADSRAAVDAFVDRAIAGGGSEVGSARDYGFMYQRSVADPDRHVLEIFYMNEAEFPGA